MNFKSVYANAVLAVKLTIIIIDLFAIHMTVDFCHSPNHLLKSLFKTYAGEIFFSPIKHSLRYDKKILMSQDHSSKYLRITKDQNE